MGSEGLSYAAAGVDIEAYERALERVKPLIAATHGKEVVEGVGPFAGLYALPGGGHLAASADGVGTKIKVAIAASSHRGIGVDIVNHCVNDIATARARGGGACRPTRPVGARVRGRHGQRRGGAA